MTGHTRWATPTTTTNRLVSLAAALVVTSAAWYLAPLEYAAGLWLGLTPWTAWTITGVVEGLLVLAILTGRTMRPALTLTWVSAALGQAHASGTLTADPDWVRATTSVIVVTAMVTALALTHHTLRTRADARALLALEQTERARAELERARADALAEQRARAEQQERARLSEASALRAQRDHELELERARSYAATEAARLQAEAEQAAREHELALAALTPTRAATATPTPKARTAKDDLQAARIDRLHAQWLERRDTSDPLTPAALVAELGCTIGAARDRMRRWEAKAPATAEEAAL